MLLFDFVPYYKVYPGPKLFLDLRPFAAHAFFWVNFWVDKICLFIPTFSIPYGSSKFVIKPGAGGSLADRRSVNHGRDEGGGGILKELDGFPRNGNEKGE